MFVTNEILQSVARQLHKLEKFKKQQDPEFCLHVKFDPETGEEIPQQFHNIQVQPHLWLIFLFHVPISNKE